MKNAFVAAGLLTMVAVFGFMPKMSAQTSGGPTVKVTADLVSSYVWRGVKSTNTPNFQPTLALVNGGFELGVWGSSDFSGNYKEADIYATYTIGSFKLGLTDYNWNFKNRYFDYKNKETDHILEGSVSWAGTTDLPLSISLNTMFFGADKKFDKSIGAQDPSKQAYSTYLEFAYTFPKFTAFVGMTPSDGYYGDSYGKATGFGIVNVGVSASKDLKITDSFTLPVKATFGVNPQQEDVYLVFGFTF
jgi:hypothetical protein